jgi:GDP-L-fucose synthase
MILVTGGTGFVGKHLQEELARRGTEFVVFSQSECDLTDKLQTEVMFSKNRRADTILHLACFQAAGDFPAKNPGAQFLINNLIHLNVLEAWRKFMPQARLIGIGSSCAYSNEIDSLAEDNFMKGEIHGSVYAYAFTKRLLYTGIQAYNDQYNLNGSYLIPPTLFGEYDDFHIDTAHVPGALIAKFARAVREGIPEVEIWGDGTQIREFLYAGNFVRALLDLLPDLNRELLNLSPGHGTSINELAAAIIDAAGYQGNLVHNLARYVGVHAKVLNTQRLQEKYQLHLKVNLSDGIGRAVAWYMKNYEELKDARKFLI